MDIGSVISRLRPTPTSRNTEKSTTDRPNQKRTKYPRTSRGISKPILKKTRSNYTCPASPQQTTFRIRRIVLFQAGQSASANGDVPTSNPISRDLLPRTSSKQAPSLVFMHGRGTKRPAEDNEFELRSELALGAGHQGATRYKEGMLGTAAEVIHSGLDKMVDFLKFLPWPRRSASNADSDNVSPKRIKLTVKGGGDSESVTSRMDSGLQEHKWIAADLSCPRRPSITDGGMPPFAGTEVTVGSFSGPGCLSGSFPEHDGLNTSSTTTPMMPSTNRERNLNSSSGPWSTTQPLSVRRHALPADFKDPHSRSRLFSGIMRSRGGARSHLSLGTIAKSRMGNDAGQTRSSSDDSAHSSTKNEDGEEKDSVEGSGDSTDPEVSQPATGLSVIDNSKGILDTTEALQVLKISEKVTQREEREREAKKREEELERIEQERQREEERKRVEEELIRQAEEQRLREESERRGGLRQPNNDLFPGLSAEWTARVQRSLQPGNGDLAETLETKLKSHDFERLVPSTVWLNDNIVNGTLLWLDRYVNEAAGITDVKAQTRKCLMPGSFFFTRLLDHGVRGTERTLRRLGVNKDNILDIETILMPICQVNHWTLVVVEPRKRKISHFDSLNPAGSDGKRALAKDWVKTILGGSFVDEEWSFAKYRAPRQTNGWDCGVHTVLNGVCLGLGIEPLSAYSSDQLPELRKRIAAILLNQGFKGEFSLDGC